MARPRVYALEACRGWFLFLVFLSIQGTAASVLFKRDAPIATVNIPLTVNKDRRYVAGVNMSTSPAQQSFKFVISSNTGYSAVAGVSCDGCDGVPTYNASASTSERPIGSSTNITVGSASISGSLIKENCSLHEVNGTAWKYPNQTIIVANSSSSIFSDITSGLLGLGTNANGLSGDFYDTIFGGWLVRNPSRDNFSFGMDLKPPVFTSDGDQGNGGVLHWVLPDSSAYQGNVVWNTASVSAGPANAPTSSDNVSDTTPNAANQYVLPESDWSVELNGWTASVSGTTVANSSSAPALIEPFFSDIFFPVSQANLFYAAVPSAVKINSFVDGAQAWTVPCDTAVSIAFNFAGQAFPLDQTQLIEQQENGTCIGTIKAWPDESVTNFMFGSSFISAFYIIFVIGRPDSGVPNSVGMAMKATSGSGTPVGAIVGGTVGGVVVVAILIVGAYLLGRRGHRNTPQFENVSAPPRTDEREKFTASRNDEGSDEGAAQYVVFPVPRNGPQATPLTADSARPLLSAQTQDPQSPAFNLPNTPDSPMDFLTLSSGAPSHSSHRGEPSTRSVASHISYNPPALAANMSASRYNASGADSSGRTMVVGPFIPPSAPASTRNSVRNQKIVPGSSPHPDIQNTQIPQPTTTANPSSPQDIDPFSPSTASGHTAPPFILSPTPQSAMLRSDVLPGSHPSRVEAGTPAPPYTANPESLTLVGTSEDAAADARSQQQRLEKA